MDYRNQLIVGIPILLVVLEQYGPKSTSTVMLVVQQKLRLNEGLTNVKHILGWHPCSEQSVTN